MSLCREVFPREHLSTERIVQHNVLLWKSSHLIPDIISQSGRSLGTTPTQVLDDPSSRLTELEEYEEIKVDILTYKQRKKQTEFRLYVPACINSDMVWEKSRCGQQFLIIA